eukprot:scaffold58777_cov38-Prasinocladus_malaysianus.AAC.2
MVAGIDKSYQNIAVISLKCCDTETSEQRVSVSKAGCRSCAAFGNDGSLLQSQEYEGEGINRQ